MECVALAFGPLVAGAIAHATSWRIPFWITVPVAVCDMLAVGLLVNGLPQPKHANFETKHRFQQLDLLGFFFFVPATVCMILALQWGGILYAWSDPRIITLIILAIVSVIGFILAQRRKGDKAMLPLHLLRQRSVALGAVAQFSVSGSLFVFGFYVGRGRGRIPLSPADRLQLPIYFQSIRGASTLDSGLMYLPTAIPFAISIFSAGFLTSYIGYWTPLMAIGTLLLALGGGLLSTLQLYSLANEWVTYQVLFGIGAGLLFQQTYTAVQTILDDKLVATALVCLSFTQELGGIVALAVSQNIFLTLIIARLTKIVPDLDPRTIIDQGTVSLPNALPEQYRQQVYEVYTRTVTDVFYIGVVLACLTACALGIEWGSVKDEEGKGAIRLED